MTGAPAKLSVYTYSAMQLLFSSSIANGTAPSACLFHYLHIAYPLPQTYMCASGRVWLMRAMHAKVDGITVRVIAH